MCHLFFGIYPRILLKSKDKRKKKKSVAEITFEKIHQKSFDSYENFDIESMKKSFSENIRMDIELRIRNFFWFEPKIFAFKI